MNKVNKVNQNISSFIYDNEKFPNINSRQNALGKNSVSFLGSVRQMEVEQSGYMFLGFTEDGNSKQKLLFPEPDGSGDLLQEGS